MAEEEKALKLAQDKSARDEMKHSKQLREFLKSVRDIDGNVGELDAVIEKAVDEPVLYNFAINADGTIAGRMLPKMENKDGEYVKKQETFIKKRRSRRVRGSGTKNDSEN